MNRNRWILGGISLVILFVLIIYGSVILRTQWQSTQAHIDHRAPLQSLGYCSSTQLTPCVLSFNLNSNGNMIVNILKADSDAPDFYLKIRDDQSENTYECQNVEGFATSVSCTGVVMPLGESFQFLILSKKQDELLAEGRFPIIGLALATPEIYSTPTSTPPPLKPHR